MTNNVSTPLPAATKFKTQDFGTNGHGPAHILYDSAEAEVLGLVTASPAANTIGARLKSIATPMTNFGAGEYETVAASATAQALGATGAAGDYLSGVLVVPASTSPGSVTLYDGSSSPDVGITLFVGGASSVSNLVPFFIPLGMISLSGAWKITTGSNVSCIGTGNFT